MAGGTSQGLAVTVLSNGHNVPNIATHYKAAAYHPPLAQVALLALVAMIALIVLMLQLRSALLHSRSRSPHS